MVEGWNAGRFLMPTPDAPAPRTGAEAVAERVIQEVAELPDRTSPNDWPEAMLVTADELRAILMAALPSKAVQP